MLNAQSFRITHSNIDNQGKVSNNCNISYDSYEESIDITSDSGTISYGPVKFNRTYSEQGLFFKEYITKNTMYNGVKRIYRFGYDRDNEPVLVLEILYTSSSNYQLNYYYTNHYFELGSRR